ncbi:uncharacterized protein LOC141685062 [Apium graveolens]|uniref:uncharacterized protein LOC141685062 n=1 Tax=Apium graveolens TaxID=4045 RepID=UPI003D7BB1D8
MQQQQQQFQQQMLQQAVRPEQQAPPAAPVVTFKQFQSVKPLEFEGFADPTKARAWLKEMEKAFVLVKVEEDHKTDFASYFLKREANYWWESKKALEGEGVNQMEIKFLELKQGNLSVTDYEAKFTELARFVPEQVYTDEKRAKRFHQGLKSWIRSRVAVFELTTYTALVQKAVIIEGETEASQKEKGPGNFQNCSNRRPGFQAQGNVNFRRTEQGNQRTGNRLLAPNQQRLIRPPIPDCRTCGKKHTGICNKPNITCFKCKQKGHYYGECPIGKAEVTCFQCGRK